MDERDSLDPVANWESVARLAPPDAWDGDFLRPDQILRDDLMKKERGWSVQRAECTTLDVAAYVAEGLGYDPAQCTVAMARTEDLRKVVTTGEDQALFVLEKWLLSNPAHALVYARPGLGKGEVKKIREGLIKLLRRVPSLRDAFAPSEQPNDSQQSHA